MSDNKDKVKDCVRPEEIGLLKEIISERDCRDKVRKYLDLLEIPDRFFACMFEELVKIFGTALFEPNPYYYDSEEREKFVEGGWYNALKTTCWILDMEWLLKTYEQLSWMNSDYFDEWVGDKIIEYLFEKDNYCERDYEIFLKRKGVI